MTQTGLVRIGGRLCLDFCNTVEHHDSTRSVDLLQDGYRALIWWCVEAGVLDDTQAAHLYAFSQERPSEANACFARAKAIREAIYQLFVAAIKNRPPDDQSLSTFNEAVQRANTQRELAASSEMGLHWIWRDRMSPDVMLWPIVLSAVDLLTVRDLGRVRQCPGCGWLFYDQSRNRSRTWCGMQYCGNRAKAHRFHQRQKTGTRASNGEQDD